MIKLTHVTFDQDFKGIPAKSKACHIKGSQRQSTYSSYWIKVTLCLDCSRKGNTRKIIESTVEIEFYIVSWRRSRKHFWLWFNLAFIYIANKDGVRLMTATQIRENIMQCVIGHGGKYRKWKSCDYQIHTVYLPPRMYNWMPPLTDGHLCWRIVLQCLRGILHTGKCNK